MFKSKKLFSIVLAIALVLSVSVTALAAWPSFQNDNSNNGVAASAPPIAAPTATAVPLPFDNSSGDVYSGIDTTSVIDNGIAYTLYNGGDANGTYGGARVQATNLSNASKIWNIQIDGGAGNSNQLSVPYYDTGSDTLYAAITVESNEYGTVPGTGVDGWTISPTPTPAVVEITNGTATWTGASSANGDSISTTVTVDRKVSYLYLPTNLTANSGTAATYTITLTPTSGSAITLATGTVPNAPYGGTYDSYTGAIPAGTYTLTVTVSGLASSANTVTMSSIALTRYDWRLYSVSSATSTSPKVTRLVDDWQLTSANEGQVNTPISYDNNGNIYWGVYGGTHSYYQYAPSTSTLTAFTPNTGGVPIDFYNAGAAFVTIGGNGYMVFGSDQGYLYVQSVTNFGSTTATTPIPVTPRGQIRSSVVSKGGYVYFTNRTSGSDGLLLGITTANLLSSPTVYNISVSSSQTSTSTPVVSANNIIYIGTNNLFTSGTVQAFTFNGTAFTAVGTIYSGDPVQASPIVWSTADSDFADDYVYFTTNSSSGAGFCYLLSREISTGTITTSQEWTVPNTSGNKYSVQGMASDNGYLVWGDDGNNLYIAH
jgi:hypothetical protein